MDKVGKFLATFWGLVIVFAIAFALATIGGCAGTVKTYDAETGKKVSSTPAGVAVIQAAADQMEECPDPQTNTLKVEEIKGMSASAQAEYMRALPMLMLLGQMQTKGNDCYTQVAKEAQAFFTAQSIKYQQWGTVGKVGLIGGFTYLGASSLFDAFAAASAGTGDISIGSITQTKSDDPYGAGGEGSGTGGAVGGSQVLNIGAGDVATGQGMINERVDKAMHTTFDESDSNLDGSGSPSGVVLDDNGDGSNNDPSLW